MTGPSGDLQTGQVSVDRTGALRALRCHCRPPGVRGSGVPVAVSEGRVSRGLGGPPTRGRWTVVRASGRRWTTVEHPATVDDGTYIPT